MIQTMQPVYLKGTNTMRVNIYDHDLTGRVELAKSVTDEGAPFTGVRFYLGPTIMHTEKDDDTAAVTFWFHDDATFEPSLLIKSLAKALRLLGVNELPEESPETEDSN